RDLGAFRLDRVDFRIATLLHSGQLRLAFGVLLLEPPLPLRPLLLVASVPFRLRCISGRLFVVAFGHASHPFIHTSVKKTLPVPYSTRSGPDIDSLCEWASPA